MLDASVLIAFFDPANVHHDAAKGIISRGEAMAASALTVAEVLVPPDRQGLAVSVHEDIEALGVAVAPIADSHCVGIAHVRNDPGLRMPDAVVLHLAQTQGAALATFDQRLDNAARSVGVVTSFS